MGKIGRVWLGTRDGDGGEDRGGVDRTGFNEDWARDGGGLGLRPEQAQVHGAEIRMEQGYAWKQERGGQKWWTGTGQRLGCRWDRGQGSEDGELNKVGTKMGMGMGETGMVDEGWALGGMRVGRGLGDGGGTRWGWDQKRGVGNGHWAETGMLKDAEAQEVGMGNVNGGWNGKWETRKEIRNRDGETG